ncbi:MAG: universal stress protein [Cyclobacteriaceae bacterium]
MKKILVPIDFSEVSRCAADFALDIAKKSDSEVVFLHSMNFNYFNDYPYASGLNLQGMIDEVKQSVMDNMEKFVEELGTDVKVSTRISGMHLLEAVKDAIKDEAINLVVLGTEGSSGWTEFLVGSNTEKIVRWADCPVISIASKTSLDSIKKVLVPIDMREIQDEFMNKLLKLQHLLSANMEFLWVKTPHNIENSEEVTKEFNDVLKKYGFKNASFTIAHNVFPSDGILEQAADLEADMVAMATHSRRGISHWLSGSMTEDTVNHIKIPVWTFKLDKKAKNLSLSSVKNASGKAEYKKIELLAE